MEFKTTIKIPKSNCNFSYTESFFSIGSCFSENIGHKLNELKITGNNNPSGTLFNPISIFKHLELIHKQEIDSNRIVCSTEKQFFHLDFHSSFSNENQDNLISEIVLRLKTQKKEFQKSDYLIITFGTAWVHQWTKDDLIVANCHKQTQQNFTKKILEIDEIVTEFEKIESYLHHFKKVIFTLSPVRHTKEGLAENQLSKSVLRVAIEKIIQKNNHYAYFPAYEIMMDDLRDYRFYTDDMIHPTPLAIQYIFNLFVSTYYSEDAINQMEIITDINKMIRHKFVSANTETKKSFYSKIIEKIEKQNLSLYFEKEIHELKTILHD